MPYKLHFLCFRCHDTRIPINITSYIACNIEQHLHLPKVTEGTITDTFYSKRHTCKMQGKFRLSMTPQNLPSSILSSTKLSTDGPVVKLLIKARTTASTSSCSISWKPYGGFVYLPCKKLLKIFSLALVILS